MAAGDLTTLASVEGWLKLQPGNSDEAVLSALISAASAFAQSYCGRQFTLQTYNDVRDGHGGRQMLFPTKPVVSVSSVTISGDVIPAGDSFQTPGYYFTDSKLMLNGYRFRRGLGNVLLSYEAGFAAIPNDVSWAVNEIIAHAYREQSRIGQSSQSNGASITTSFVIKDMPPRAETWLNQYRRVAPS